MSESPKESDEGYPEEQPGQVADEGGQDDRESDTPDEADRGDDGQATGNPRSAG